MRSETGLDDTTASDTSSGEAESAPAGGMPGGVPFRVDPLTPARPPGSHQTGRYLGRFLVLYLVLGFVLVGAVAGVVLLAFQPGRPRPATWSIWKPSSSNVAKATAQIANHVAPRYRLNAAGSQLVAVLPSAPELTRDTKVSSVSTIAIRPTPQAQTFSRILNTHRTYQIQLCGLGSQCSIESGQASASRERLLRREALEIALYTFKYLPQVDSLIAYMPPPPGQAPSTVLFLERSDFRTQLSQPIAKTLPLTLPPLPSSPDTSEAAKIDSLTLPVEYTYNYEALPDGTVAIILAPSSF